MARRSNEHIVVLEQGGQAIRCRSVKRRPEVNKWDAEKIRNIVASPRMPNPEDPSRPDFDIDKTRLPRLAVPAEDVGRAQGRPVSELLRRDFRITKRMLERYDYTAGCPGYNAALSNKPRMEHNKECRERIEAQMHEDPEDLVRIFERDIRLERPNRGDERSPEEGSPDSVEEGQPPDHAVQPADQQGCGCSRERRRGSCALWSRRRPSYSTDSVVKLKLRNTKRRRFLGMDEDVRNILSKLGLRSCDGVGQKLTKMIANMTDEQVQNKVKTQHVTKIIEAVLQISDKPTPHDDQQWEDFHWNVVFTDDVNHGEGSRQG